MSLLATRQHRPLLASGGRSQAWSRSTASLLCSEEEDTQEEGTQPTCQGPQSSFSARGKSASCPHPTLPGLGWEAALSRLQSTPLPAQSPL